MSAPATPSSVVSEAAPRNRIIHGDCVDVMAGLPPNSVDFILTDPPYGVGYRSRDGRTILNDDRLDWTRPAYAQMHRLLKPGSFCVSFYGWNAIADFSAAWREAGFRVVGHIVFRKRFASSTRYLRHYHENAFLLAKGRPARPVWPIPDVIDFEYSGNRLHPTEKPVSALTPFDVLP
ncbi:DNA methyltransferase [Stakelama tenebrarum]|uniref:site-specific DNA-methyltransferase (adenine-specific) n=1 Tax=Stakelama tenebrarum TaxID=2711215 RepID=A0A6G6Y3H6_9SPHN|nr:DNA methyltransferase [Sphingosinithalassobacter tenebrarum]QIG79449.1 DNA methylase [Sphingosinithalassobacter tenebrarum]